MVTDSMNPRVTAKSWDGAIRSLAESVEALGDL